MNKQLRVVEACPGESRALYLTIDNEQEYRHVSHQEEPISTLISIYENAIEPVTENMFGLQITLVFGNFLCVLLASQKISSNGH